MLESKEKAAIQSFLMPPGEMGKYFSISPLAFLPQCLLHGEQGREKPWYLQTGFPSQRTETYLSNASSVTFVNFYNYVSICGAEQAMSREGPARCLLSILFYSSTVFQYNTVQVFQYSLLERGYNFPLL